VISLQFLCIEKILAECKVVAHSNDSVIHCVDHNVKSIVTFMTLRNNN